MFGAQNIGNTIELEEVILGGDKNTYVSSGDYGPPMQPWDSDNKFMNGLSNTAFGVVATIGAVAAIPETGGISGLALSLTIGQVSIGISQMADSFNDKPSDVLHNFSSVPGLIAGQKGSEYAPIIDAVSVWATGSVNSPNLLGNSNGFINSVNSLSQGESVLYNGISVYSTSGTVNSGVSAYNNLKKQ